MVAMRTQFLFSMPFTSLPLRSFLANMSMLIVQRKAQRQIINQDVTCHLSVALSLSKRDPSKEQRGRLFFFFFLQTQPRRLYKGCCCQFQQGGGWEAGAASVSEVCAKWACVWSCSKGFGAHDNLWPDILAVVLVFLQSDCRLCGVGCYTTFLHRSLL